MDGSDVVLVTGASGHLGSHLVERLERDGATVRAGLRDPARPGALRPSTAEVVPFDLLDRSTLPPALDGVTTLFHVAGVFRHWAREPEHEIVAPNVTGTRNVLEAAAMAGVRRVVLVGSSVAAVPAVEGHEPAWRQEDHGNVYVRAKIGAERLAFALAADLGLDLVSVLPATMVGPTHGPLTLSMRLLDDVMAGRLPLAPDLRFNYVDVRDVADGMRVAADRGTPGHRYVLAGDAVLGVRELAVIAREVEPTVAMPRVLPHPLAFAMAAAMEATARLTGNEPRLLRSQLRLWGHDEPLDATTARRDLGWQPRPTRDALREAFAFLAGRPLPAAVTH